ncbi:MAG: fibronectin type III-like domain-contianing protein, partial [Actinomycetales bacterium]
QADTEAVGTDGRVEISAVVRNVGARRGEEVVQSYVNDVAAEVTRPVRQLIVFARLRLEPVQASRVTF